jgi:hypothetical protein
LLDVHDFVLPTAIVAVTPVHAQEHIRPIAAFRATRAGVDGKDGVGLVVLVGEKILQLELGKALLRDLHFLVHFRLGFTQLDEHTHIGNPAIQFREGLQPAADGAGLVMCPAGLGLIGPEGRASHDVFQFDQTGAQFGDVKDTSPTPGGVPGGSARGL